MKKSISVILGYIFVSCILLGGCSSSPTTSSETNIDSNAGSTASSEQLSQKTEQISVKWPYYKIAKDGEVKGHLLGTVHIGKPEMYPFPDELIEDFNSSSNFITEIGEMDEAVDEEAMMASMMAKESLTTGMTEETQEKYQEILASYDLTEDDVAQLNRYGLSMMLFAAASSDADSNALTEGAPYGIETQLGVLHEQNPDQKHIGLETAQFQQEISIKSQEKPEDISDWVDTLKTKKENADSSSNVAAIDDYIEGKNDFSDVHPEQNEIMNFSRNQTWAEKLPEYLQGSDKCFIAVGNAHLSGERGLVELLKQQGFEVTLVTFD